METTIGELLRVRGSNVHSVTPESTLIEALQTMARYKIGAVLVVDNDGVPIGIFSERDFARKAAERYPLPADTAVRELMTVNLVTVKPTHTVQECMASVTNRRVRHLPVVEEGRLLGIISIGDLVKASIAEKEALINEKQSLIQKLEGYISGTIS